MIGYFFITKVVGKGLKRYLEGGDLAFLYIGWYGLTRVIMEPLRHPAYNMGTDGYWSWFWSFVFVLVAAVCIAGNHIIRFIIAQKKKTYVLQKDSTKIGVISSLTLLVPTILLVILGAIYMAKGTPAAKIQFSDYNNGLIMLMIGLSTFALLGTTIPYLIAPRLKKENE